MEEDIIKSISNEEYKHGFESQIENEEFPRGLNEEIIRMISERKEEPEWLLEFRLKAFRKWQTMTEPDWAHLHYKKPNYQDIIYLSIPKKKEYSEVVKTFDKLGISLDEDKDKFSSVTKNEETMVAVDAVIDSVSVKTMYSKMLEEQGILFCSFGEAVKKYPDLVKKYLGSVVPAGDNFFAALNSAVFSEGSFCYIPKGVRCPIDLSTYFRINAKNSGQFERTLIVADEGAYVSYLEGCTAPQRDENQLHAAIVEIIAMQDAEVKYSTVQNWFPGDKDGKGGIYNFVTKRGLCKGARSKISWTQVETGSAVTWKYPGCVLLGHIGKNTRSLIVSKGISAGRSQNSYRGLVRIGKNATHSRNFSQCDSLLMGDKCGAHTWPYADCHNNSSILEHEASTGKISEDQLFYCQQRGISMEKAVSLIVNGYAKGVLEKLPLEFAAEAQELLSITLKNSIG